MPGPVSAAPTGQPITGNPNPVQPPPQGPPQGYAGQAPTTTQQPMPQYQAPTPVWQQPPTPGEQSAPMPPQPGMYAAPQSQATPVSSGFAPGQPLQQSMSAPGQPVAPLSQMQVNASGQPGNSAVTPQSPLQPTPTSVVSGQSQPVIPSASEQLADGEVSVKIR